MMNTIQDLSPILLGMIVAAFAWFMRMQASRKSKVSIRQLEQAAELLLVHNSAMERFLDDPDAPSELKKRMISFSDSMTNREVVKQMADWASSRPLTRPEETDEVRSIEDLLTATGGRRPDLVEDFGVSIVAAVVGAALRWPESAALIEQAFPRLVATPQRSVAVVAAASVLKPALAFPARQMAPAAV
jgi:hypothetical protein